MAEDPDRIRLDKFLWQARFFKSRAQATAFVASGRLRLDGVRTDKAHLAVRIGTVLTFPLGKSLKIIKVMALPVRRGPASEARGLYQDLSPQAAAPAKPGRDAE